MLLFVPPILIGMVAGLASGGSLSRLGLLRFRFGWLIIVAFVVQVLIFSPVQLPANDLVVPALHILSNLVLLGAIALNWGISGIRIVALGLLLNFSAIASNGGFMPVSGQVLEQVGRIEDLRELRVNGNLSKAVLLTHQTRLPFLADIFVLDVPPVKGRVFSIGDVAISVGAFVLVFQGMRRPSSEGPR